MTIQCRNVYNCPDQNLNRILQDIANRLDILEGLRPDLLAGYVQLSDLKKINTSDLTEDFQAIVDGITITDNEITINTGDLILTNSTIKLTIGASYGSIEIYDANNVLIHKME